MALSDTLKLIITADGSKASSEFQKVGKDAGKSLSAAEGGSGKLNAAMGLLGPAAVAAGAAAVAFAKTSVDAYQNVGSEVLKLQRYTGGTAEETSRLRFAMQQAGVDVDGAAKAMGIFSKNIENSPSSFEKYRIATQDSSGNTLSFHDILLNTATQFERMPNGAEKTAMALKLFGKAGADMIPFLNRGKEGIADLEKQTDKYGMTLSGKNLADIKANKEAQRQFTAALQGVQLMVGKELLPVLTKLTSQITTLVAPVSSVIDKFHALDDASHGLAGGVAKIMSMNLGGGFMNFGESAKKAAVDVDSIASSTHSSSTSVQDFIDKQKQAGIEYSSTADAAQAYKEAQTQATDATDSASTSSKDLTSNLEKQDAALKQLNDRIHAAIDPLFGFQDALDANVKAAADMATANLNVMLAQKAYTDAVKDHGKKSLEAMDALGKLKTAQQEQADASKAQERSALDVDTAMNTLAEKIKAQPGMLDEAKNSIDRWVAQGSIGAEQAKEYKKQLEDLAWIANAMNGIDSKMKVTVDAQQALAALHAISVAQAALSDTQLSHGYDRTMGGQQRAHGGPVKRGESYIVGDRRGMDTAEVFTPSQDGFIHPNAGGVGGGGVPPVYVYIGGDQVAATVTRQARADARGRRN